MSQDYSRINFDPKDDYFGVLLQQGRPLTDADWNAMVAQFIRRTQAGTFDTFGPAVVPEQTPDGFLITPGGGTFDIGVGRIYVDGLLAQNHGTGPRVWDTHLAEETGSLATPYASQPYLPNPPALPAGPYLVYVDVWQREVTELSEAFVTGKPETRRLIDVAVGVDTTQRLQTVWQVRALGVGAGTDCATPLDTIAGWDALVAPSAGRLTTATGVVAGEPDPCLVPPLGGYKGAENQLYRVEVHTAGAPGTATFKWSRDNGSVQSRVQTIPDLTHVVLDSIGKDGVLRFDSGDWIEITDDFRELNGQPGLLRQIATLGGVNDATRTLTLTSPLPAGAFPVDAQFRPTDTRNTRVRKWDQAGIVKRADGTQYTDLNAGGSTGEITIPVGATQLLLETGILVSFSVAPAGGQFHVGDYWVFAARTNNASVEILDAAPPRGIHHHYAKIAVVTPPTDVDDCRVIWPPDRGCCTKVVKPGQSIQAAIDSLPPTGGCVCLKSGVHDIDEPLVIPLSNVILHGEAPGTRVVGHGIDTLLVIGSEGDIENIEIAMISFEILEIGTGTMIMMVILNARHVHIHDCSLRLINIGMAPVNAIYAWQCSQLRVAGNFFDRCYSGVILEGPSLDCTVEDNDFVGLLNSDATGPYPLSFDAVFVQKGGTADIRENRFIDFNRAVWAGEARVNVDDNEIRRLAYPAAIDTPSGPGALLYAIVLGGFEGSRARGNRIELTSQIYGGISANGLDCEVVDNDFISTYQSPSLIGPLGVWSGDFSGGPSGAGDNATISRNRFSGVQIGIRMRGPSGVRIAQNSMTGTERTGGGIFLDSCTQAVISDNTFENLGIATTLVGGFNNRIVDNTASALRIAGFFFNESALDVQGNHYDDVTHLGLAGINHVASATFSDNRIAHCGYLVERGSLALSLALLQTEPFVVTDVAIRDSEFLSTGVSPDGSVQTDALANGVACGLISHLQITDNAITYPLGSQFAADRDHHALWLVGMPCLTIFLGAGRIELAFGAALITGNVFQGPAVARLVDIQLVGITDNWDLRFEKLTFNDNRCDHTSNAGDAIVTADLYGSHMIVNGNQVKTPPGGFSIGVGGRERVVTLGNYTTRPYTGVNTTVPTTHTDFNALTI